MSTNTFHPRTIRSRYNHNAALPMAWYVVADCAQPNGRQFWSFGTSILSNISIAAVSVRVTYECPTADAAVRMARLLLTAGDIDVRTYPGTAYHTAAKY